MSTLDYSGLQATADALLKVFGNETITYTSVTPGAYDPSTGSSSENTTDYTVKAVILPYKKVNLTGQDIDWQGTEAIKMQARQLLISASDLTVQPKVGDRVTAQGSVWTVVGGMENKPDSTAVYYGIVVTK